MVRIEEKKLIIEYFSTSPEWELHSLVESLLYLIGTQQSDFLNHDHLYNVSQLISAMYPTQEQLKEGLQNIAQQ